MPIPKEVMDLIIERCKLIVNELADEKDTEIIVLRSYIQGMMDTGFCKVICQRICPAPMNENEEPKGS